ncbi:MAG: PQQ-binding-like beta-propeller repeat protein [Gemmataceae bacterium]|nr:PQQ-binding-like beta-propeller repeat protein [Gemmataceae bacterium]
MPTGPTALRTSLALSLLLLTTTALPADNWPRFRGPNGTGVADDKDVPVTWNEKAGVLWKVPLPALGHSSPIIWGDRLFLQAAPRGGSGRLLLCLNVRDGKQLWSRTVPGTTAKTHPKSSLASSTPATDGERVYTAFWDGREIIMSAYDMGGKPVWDRRLGTFTSQHGAGASPIVYQDKVYFANDQDETSTLYVFDSKTGKTVWEKKRPAYRACYSAPFLLERQGHRPELIVVSTLAITSYEPHSGRVNWNYEWKFSAKMPLRTTGSPIYHDGMLFVCSGDGGGDRHMIALNLDGVGPRTKVTLAWENKKDFPYVPTLLARDGYLYFVNDKGMAGCYHARTGKRVWFERLDDNNFTSSPVLIDGKMYIGSEEGNVYVMAAEPTFRLLAKNPVGELIRATPAVAANHLFLRGQRNLFCIGRR